jgi:N6-L-threonylcarbamoyladenine synthase
MRILGIETSCDETALSIVECSGDLTAPQFTVIDSVLNSQAKLHAEYGGVFPTLAKREHLKNLPILLEELVSRNSLSFSKEGDAEGRGRCVDAIAVTQGPGLEPALWTGIVFAKELGEKWNVPVIPTNHMEGHMLSPLLHLGERSGVRFPAIALLISGGHTQLVKINVWGSYEIMGDTKDDAVGEAFDKVARILGLPYPGGPEISKQAESSRLRQSVSPFACPRPMLHSKDFNFSFSGLKTHVLYAVQKIGMPTAEQVQEIAHGFEDAVTEVLVKKTFNAIEKSGAETLILGGGVVANKHVRNTFETLCKDKNITLLLPTHEASTDNALMIAAAGYVEFLQNKTLGTDFKADGNLAL